jgi:hypothetical protein
LRFARFAGEDSFFGLGEFLVGECAALMKLMEFLELPRNVHWAPCVLSSDIRPGTDKQALKEPALEPTYCSSAVLADFCIPVNKIPLPIASVGFEIETVRTLHRGRLVRARPVHGHVVSGTSL